MSWRALLFGCFVASSAFACEDFLLPTGASPTQNFLTYLELLSEQGWIGLRELEALREGAWAAPASSAQVIHAEVVKAYLEEPSLDRRAIQVWAEAQRARLVSAESARDDVREQTAPTFVEMEFRPLNRGTFEMMTTVVTRAMWKQKTGRAIADVTEGDLPADGISWYSAAAFANLVSLEKGLEPFYVFEGIDWDPATSAEAGTLKPATPRNAFRFWEKAYRARGYRSAEGYRIPSYEEWNYVVSHFVMADPGRLNAGALLLVPRPGLGQLTDWGAFLENSGSGLRPVDEDGFMEVEGHKFYGMIGNVWQWIDRPNIDMGRGRYPPRIHTFSIVGGDYRRPIRLVIDHTMSQDGLTGDRVGFRLVRSLPRVP